MQTDVSKSRSVAGLRLCRTRGLNRINSKNVVKTELRHFFKMIYLNQQEAEMVPGRVRRNLMQAGVSKSRKTNLIHSTYSNINRNYMYCVYILQSIAKQDKIYIGYSLNVQERLKEHNRGKVASTQIYYPWKLMFYCAFNNKPAATSFERHLKTHSGRIFLKKHFLTQVPLPPFDANNNHL